MFFRLIFSLFYFELPTKIVLQNIRKTKKVLHQDSNLGSPISRPLSQLQIPVTKTNLPRFYNLKTICLLLRILALCISDFLLCLNVFPPFHRIIATFTACLPNLG